MKLIKKQILLQKFFTFNKIKKTKLVLVYCFPYVQLY